MGLVKAHRFILSKAPWIAFSFLFCFHAVAEESAGRVLFVSGPAGIVDASGTERIMSQGDPVRVGDRLVTRDGAMGQIKLSDGSLVALRPASALTVESHGAASREGISTVVRLERGAIRVINRETLVGGSQSALLVRTPTATIRLVNADGDAFVIGVPASGTQDVNPGTYSRVIAGAGSIQTGQGNLWLELGAVGFAADGQLPPSSLGELPAKLLAAIASPGMGNP